MQLGTEISVYLQNYSWIFIYLIRFETLSYWSRRKLKNFPKDKKTSVSWIIFFKQHFWTIANFSDLLFYFPPGGPPYTACQRIHPLPFYQNTVFSFRFSFFFSSNFFLIKIASWVFKESSHFLKNVYSTWFWWFLTLFLVRNDLNVSSDLDRRWGFAAPIAERVSDHRRGGCSFYSLVYTLLIILTYFSLGRRRRKIIIIMKNRKKKKLDKIK